MPVRDGTSNSMCTSMNQAGEVFASRPHLVLIPPVGLYRIAQLFGWLASNSTLPTLGFTHSRMYFRMG